MGWNQFLVQETDGLDAKYVVFVSSAMSIDTGWGPGSQQYLEVYAFKISEKTEFLELVKDLTVNRKRFSFHTISKKGTVKMEVDVEEIE